ncbi:MAG: type III secretion system chaperone [Pseudomonadota bacterium]
MAREDIGDLIAKLGAEIGFPDLALDEGGFVAIVNDDTTVLNIDYYEEEQAIVMYATVAELTDETRFDIYEEMLMANFMWKETLGATLCISPTTEHALLMASIETDDLDYQTFSKFYQNVHRLTWAFSDRFKKIAGDESADEERVEDPASHPTAPLPSSFA